MLQWIRSRLRAFVKGLIEDEEPLDLDVLVVDGETGETEKMRALTTEGMSLVCESVYGERLVRIEDAADHRHWHKVWCAMGGVTPCWPDGTPYDFFADSVI